MQKLIIIGNGFDLALGLPTSYTDFFKSMVNKSFNFENNVSHIVSPIMSQLSFKDFIEYKNQHNYRNDFFQKND